MAVNLSAVFRVRDEGTSRLRRIMQQTDRLTRSTQQATRASDTFRDSNGRLRNAMGRFVSEANRASSANSRFATSLSGVRVGAGGVSASLSGMQSALVGIIGAYAGATAASKAFEATIGAAAKYEQDSTVLKAMMNDEKAYGKYIKMIDNIAIDSPLLNSADMVTGSKGLLTMTKDLGTLEDSWQTISKLVATNPMQGVEGAVYSLKALQSGDIESIVDRFDMNRADLNPLKGLSFEEQIKGLDKVLAKMNVTDQLVSDMSGTTLGQFNSLKERISTFFRDVGEESNEKLGKALTKINDTIGKLNIEKVSDTLGNALAGVVDKAIEVGKFLWKWKEPLAYVAGAITAALGAFAVIGTISLLANPISLIAGGIAAVAVGFKALYDNSETFRGVISGVVSQAKALFEAFQNGGTGGLVDRLFGSGTAEKVSGIVDTIKTKFSELQSGFEIVKNALALGWQVLSDIFTNAWSIISPILSGLWSVLQVIGGVAVIVFNNIIAPALQFTMQLFSTLWSVAQPILTLLGAALQLVGTIVLWLWNTILAPLVEFILGAVKNAFAGFTEAVQIVGDAFNWVGGIIDTIADKISGFADMLSNVKLPSWVTNGVSSVVNFVGKVTGANPDGSHKTGLWSVPFNSYLSELHVGETVLPRKEAEAYRSMAGNGFGFLSGLQSQLSGDSFGGFDGAMNNDYSYDRVAGSIANQTTNNTYNNTSNQTTNNGGNDRRGGVSEVHIAKLADEIIVREEADIERIAYAVAQGIRGSVLAYE